MSIVEPVIFFLLVALVIAVGCCAVFLYQRRVQRARLNALQHKIKRLQSELALRETDPAQALDHPEWVTGQHPAIQRLHTQYARAQRLWAPAVSPVDPSSDVATNPRLSNRDLNRIEMITSQLEDVLRETETIMRFTQSGAEVDNVQLQQYLEPRWGERLRYPDTSGMSGRPRAEYLLDHLWPCRPRFVTRVSSAASQVIRERLAHGTWITDEYGFLWPASVNIDQWAVYRTVMLGSHGRLKDLSPVEIANVYYEALGGDDLDAQSLFHRAQRILGFLFFTPKNREVLQDALTVGLRTDRLRLVGENIARGRKDFESGYRRVVHDI